MLLLCSICCFSQVEQASSVTRRRCEISTGPNGARWLVHCTVVVSPTEVCPEKGCPCIVGRTLRIPHSQSSRAFARKRLSKLSQAQLELLTEQPCAVAARSARC